jgi:hypothetical protein
MEKEPNMQEVRNQEIEDAVNGYGKHPVSVTVPMNVMLEMLSNAVWAAKQMQNKVQEEYYTDLMRKAYRGETDIQGKEFEYVLKTRDELKYELSQIIHYNKILKHPALREHNLQKLDKLLEML